jgi:hypothetical protein
MPSSIRKIQILKLKMLSLMLTDSPSINNNFSSFYIYFFNNNIINVDIIVTQKLRNQKIVATTSHNTENVH